MGAAGSVSKARYHLTAENIIDQSGPGSNLTQQCILVTGATSGIGVETARALACGGAKVYVMGRDEKKLEAVLKNIKQELQEKQSHGSVQGAVCDLNSLISIKQFAEKFIRENPPLNILILNAGVFSYNYEKTVDGLEQTIGVNHIGQAYLTKLLMPLLIANAPSRIVVVSSELQSGPALDYQMLNGWNSNNEKEVKKGWGMMRSYQQSKLANVLFARALSSRYKQQRITAYSLHPGVIKTNLSAGVPLSGLLHAFLKTKTIAEGAATTVYCAVEPNLEIDTGRFFDDSTVTNQADKWTDDDLNTFWDWTEKVIQERIQ